MTTTLTAPRPGALPSVLRGLSAAALLLPAPARADEPAAAPAASAPAPSEDVGAHTVLLWQGFRHFWERHAPLGFHMPHRVSLFESRVHDEVHRLGPDGLHSEASFTFAQSPGVDGDFMYPEGYAARVYAPDLDVHRGVLRLGGEDVAADPALPRGVQRFHELVSVPAVPGAEEQQAAALLQGLAFHSRCLDGPEACNSDGIWPYRFRATFAPCELRDARWLCPLTVEVGRAWTPWNGGGPLVKPKPVNRRVAIDLAVSWAVLAAPVRRFAAVPYVFENALPTTRRMLLERQIAPLTGLPADLRAATVGLHSIAFEFFPTGERARLEQRGRYIGGWSVEVGAVALRPERGELDIGHAGGIWLPRTVSRTGVSVELGMTVLLLSGPGASVEEDVVARGALCANSHGAPGFSTWRRCAGHLDGEDERTRQTVPLVVGP